MLFKELTLKKGMKQNLFSLALLQGVNYILPLITIPYLFRVLGAERYGLVAFGYAFTQYFIIVTDFGFNLSSVKFVSENRGDKTIVNRHVNSVLVTRLLLAILCLVFFTTISFYFVRFSNDKWFFLLFFGMVLGNAVFPLWYFQGMEKMKFVTIINVTAKVLSVIPFFVFIHKPEDYYQVPFFYSIGYMAAGIISLYLIYFKMGLTFHWPFMSDIFKVIKESSGYFLSRASLSFFTTSNAFVLGLVAGNVQVGYYVIAEKLYQAYNSLISPVNGVLFPYMARNKDVKFFKRILTHVSVVNFSIVLIAISLSGIIVQILFKTDNEFTLGAIKILLATCIFTIPSILLGYPFLAAMGHPKFTNLTVILAALFHVLGLAFLIIIGKVTVISVSIMVLLTETGLLALRGVGIRKYALFRTK